MDKDQIFKISGLKLQNFRIFSSAEISDFDSHMNLFVGANGAGKSTVLDALSMLMYRLVAKASLKKIVKTMQLQREDKTKDARSDMGLSLRMYDGKSWVIGQSSNKDESWKTNLAEAEELGYTMRENFARDGFAPAIVHYSVTRNVPAVNLKSYTSKESSALSFPANFNGIFDGAFGSQSAYTTFFKWFRNEEDYENEQIRINPNFRDYKLSAVRNAIGTIIDGYSAPRVKRRPLSMVIRKGDVEFDFSHLSDGEKNYISLVADIARRLAIGTPENDNPLENPGIVFIDEIDLHLHPKWQLEALGKLIEIFPNVQFFISTHSPLVASCNPGKTYMIDNAQIIASSSSYGRTSEQILANLFGVDYPRDPAVQKIIQSAFAALANDDNNEYENHLESLKKYLGPNDEAVSTLILEQRRRKFIFQKQ